MRPRSITYRTPNVRQKLAAISVLASMTLTLCPALSIPQVLADEPAPSCGGQVATIWVSSNGTIIGGAPGSIASFINGTSGNDVIVGSNNADIISAGDGNDIVCGLGGNDIINGDAGDDILYGGEGNDILNDVIGTNQLFDDDGNNIVSGNPNVPSISSSSSSAASTSSTGSSQSSASSVASGASSSSASSVSSSSAGLPSVLLPRTPAIQSASSEAYVPTMEELSVALGIPLCDGQLANLYVDSQGWIVRGGLRDDFFDGKLRGGNGPDVIVGTPGPDKIHGGGENDIICGGGGADVIDGDAGHDRIFGGFGRDTINGGMGNDELCGDEQDDDIDGDTGNDTLCGGDGDDNLRGGIGDDKLSGGTGIDHLNGNTGNDICAGGESSEKCEATEPEISFCAPPPPVIIQSSSSSSSEAAETETPDLEEEVDTDLETDAVAVIPVAPTSPVVKKKSTVLTGVKLASGYRFELQEAPYRNPLGFARLFHDFTIPGELGSRPYQATLSSIVGLNRIPRLSAPILSLGKARPIAAGTPFTGREKRLICSVVKVGDAIIYDEETLAGLTKNTGRSDAELESILSDPEFCGNIVGTVMDAQSDATESVLVSALDNADFDDPAVNVIVRVDEDGYPYLEGDSKEIKVWNNCVRHTITYRTDGRNYACDRYREESSQWFGTKWSHPTLNIPLFGFNYRFTQFFIPEYAPGNVSVVIKPDNADVVLTEEADIDVQ